MNFIQQGGIFMVPLLLIGVAILVISAKKISDLYFRKGLTHAQLEKGINAIIFWGFFGIILGLFAHFSGIYTAMVAISQAADISPKIVAIGYAVSLTTILTGLFIFMISAILWLVFRSRYKKLTLETK